MLGYSNGKLMPGNQLRSISGHIIHTLGRVQIQLFNNNCEFFIVQKLKFNFLFGTDVMLLINAEINYKHKIVKVHGINHFWIPNSHKKYSFRNFLGGGTSGKKYFLNKMKN